VQSKFRTAVAISSTEADHLQAPEATLAAGRRDFLLLELVPFRVTPTAARTHATRLLIVGLFLYNPDLLQTKKFLILNWP
jgi:hypothetical protein